MEVLYRNPPIFGLQPPAMVFPPTHNMANLPVSSGIFSSSSSPPAYTCYPFQASPSHSSSPHVSSSSRSPTPDFPSRSASRESGVQGATLKSVLRGEVPDAYSHFLSSSRLGGSLDMHPPRQASPGRFGNVEARSSPSVFGTSSASALSPPPEDMQTEPMDLSFKRPSSASSVASSPASFPLTFPPSPAEDHQGQGSEFSLLRNLLQVGKPPHPSASSSSSSFSSSSSSDRSCDSPCSDSGYPPRPISGSTRVTLAKKNMYPVSARVSDWLLKMVQFASSIQCFREEVHSDDQLTLLLGSWSRLLLLYMAESNFQFAVTPLRTETEDEVEGGLSPDEPTMKGVEAIQTFIRKCQNMGVEAEEYYYLRMLVLFNSSYVGLQQPSKVDSINAKIQQSLQLHVQSTRPTDVMHHSRLLMCLPSLYGIGAGMVERLFCRHIDSSAVTDMDTLLTDLLRTYSLPGSAPGSSSSSSTSTSSK